jgi:hypothetical protein
LTYEQLGLRPNILVLTYGQSSWVTTRMLVKATWVTTRMAFVSFSLSPDTRVCGRNFLVRALEKLLVFLVNYAYYATIFYHEKVR